ncbi:MAG: VanW family protein [Deltaproteobacteria bacterium]|nr:VanW family protein [Deltaproteobacteria bacterium]
MKIPGATWKSELARGLALAAIFAVAGVLIGYLLIPPSPKGIDPKAPVPEFTLLGEKLQDSPDAADRALQRVRRYAASTITIKTPDGKRHEIARAALGAEIERVRLARIIADVRDPASPTRRSLAEARPKTPVVLPVPIVLNPARGIPTLMQLKDVADQPAVDARLDLESRKLLPEKEGVEIDVYATLARVERAMREGQAEVDAVADRIAPKLKAERLGNVTFDEPLGVFETAYARGPKHLLRTYNLRLAASKLDGHIIMPGDVFDFNEVVGPRDEAHGYKDAPVIAEGELVDGIGGGTCQIAGTLHGASFFAGLKIVSRRPHTRPSSYIKMGLDAAVAYPTTTLKIRNPFDYPVVLHETVRDGMVRAEVLGPKRKLTVTFVRKVLEFTPFEEVERPDPKLSSGTRVLSQRGIPGFKIQRYRIVRDGPFAVRERSTDTYPATMQIIRVGTGDNPPDKADPEGDQHPEYVADEYLTMTQGPGIRTTSAAGDDQSTGTLERRVPGRTGARGWMEKAGMRVFKNDRDKGDKACEDNPDSCAKSSDSGNAKGDKGDKGDKPKPKPKGKKKAP